MSLEQQLAVRGHHRRLVACLIVTARVRPMAEYLIASKIRVGASERGRSPRGCSVPRRPLFHAGVIDTPPRNRHWD
ncbi:MAG: hypothetical protein JO243_00390 [Solirubrobacterales bacterium]|nr:hypothetical protein [Solirubrobacterales bacterium]